MTLRNRPYQRSGALALAVAVATAMATLAGAATLPPSPGTDAPPDAVSMRPAPTTDGARTISIVESQSVFPHHNTDLGWQTVAASMGHTATIVGQDALDNIANFDGVHILIVSSGLAELPTYRVQVITEFVQSGRPVYLQGEYNCDYDPGNVAFDDIVAALGGSFTRTGVVSGNLQPMSVLGSLAAQPNAVPTLPYFWYGCAATGDATIESFLEYGGQSFGWIFTPLADTGRVLHTTDEDWIMTASPTAIAMMENIVSYLDSNVNTPVEQSSWGTLKALYR